MRQARGPAWTRRAVLTAAGAGALGGAGWAARAAGRVLSVLCWPGFDDPDLLAGFGRETGIGVRSETVATDDELFLYLRAGGIGKVGVVTPTNGAVGPLVEAGLIQPLDLGRLPNAAALLPPFRAPAWASAGGQTYAVPLLWRTGAMAYATAAGDPPGAWTDLLDERYRGKLLMLDAATDHLVTWNRARGLADPVRVSKVELKRTADLLVALKRDQVRRFMDDVALSAGMLASGECVATTSGLEALARKPGIALAHPAPGDFAICAAAAIPAGAPDVDAAYAFIDALLAPAAQVRLAGILREGVVVEPAVPFLDGALAEPFGYADLDAAFATSPFVGLPPFADDGETASYADWVLAWDRIRFARTSLDPAPPPAESPTAATPSPLPAQDGDASSGP